MGLDYLRGRTQWCFVVALILADLRRLGSGGQDTIDA